MNSPYFKHIYSYGEATVRFNFNKGTKEYTEIYFYTEHKNRKNMWAHWFTEEVDKVWGI